MNLDDDFYDEAEKLVERFETPSGTGSMPGTTAGERKNRKFYDWFSWDTVLMLGSILLFRKRCMDLVSFETRQEYDWVKGFIDGGVNIIRS